GNVYGVAAGSVTISYSVSTACGTDVATTTLTVNPLPSAGTISGPTSVCESSSITLSTTGFGGSWSSFDGTLVSVDGSGGVSGLSAGTATISYSVTNSCGTDVATYPMTVNPFPNPGTVTPVASLCAGSSLPSVYSGTIMGSGTWTSDDASIASVDASAVLYGLSAGTTHVTYTVTTVCGMATISSEVTVNALPVAGTLSGASSVCAGASTSFSTTGTGGSWSSSNSAVASVDASGNVYGVAAGSATITYTASTDCGTDASTQDITINALPNAGAITGATSVCESASTSLSTSGTGGSWSTSSSSVASVDASGTVYGVAAGSFTISYSVSTVCGTDIATAFMTVNPLPDAGTVSGASSVCTGVATSFSTTGTGGSWSSSNSAVASVDASGTVYGVAAGSATITYAVTNGCGTSTSTSSITVNASPNAGTISGATAVCVGSSVTLSTTGTGGTWSSSASGTATVSAAGVVTGVATGSVTISYTVTTACGSSTATRSITVNPAASAGTVTGATTLCTGTSTTFTASVSGGTWSAVPASRATISTSGVLYGLTAGADTVRYTVTNSCGTSVATATLTISGPTAGTVTSVNFMSIGSSATATQSVSGGTWSLSNTRVATISSTGVITALASGVDTIIYTVTGSCGTAYAYKAFTVLAATAAGTISGPSSVCVGSTITLTSTVSGGSWSSSYAPVASVVSSTGVVRGNSTGTIQITYTVGTAITIYPIQVVNSSVSAISGVASVCPGSTANYTSGTTGGTWSNDFTARGSVHPVTGIYTAVSSGVDTLRYTISNACGTFTVKKTITITAPPSIMGISGTFSAGCAGVNLVFTNTATGVWSLSDTTLATIVSVSAPSVTVTGIGTGVDTLRYTVTGTCGLSTTVRRALTFTSVPASISVTGATTVCQGSTITLSSSATGGSWVATPPSVATVNATGDVTGLAPGVDTISYVVSNSCGYRAGYTVVTVLSLPSAVTITGPSTMVIGDATLFTPSTSGGTWSNVNPSVTTVSATGLVNALAAGVDTLLYTLSNSCGTAVATKAVTVTVGAGVISGPASICLGSTATLTSTGAGGTWSSSTPTIASVVSATGVVRGNALGSATITYTVGSYTATYRVTVNNSTVASIAGAASVCPGASTTFTNSTTGGTWSNDFAARGTISNTGVYTAIASGVDTIRYTIVNGCGTFRVKKTLTVTAPPSAGSISGAVSSVCPGRSATWTNSVTGGVWSFSNATVATIASVSSPSVTLTGLTSGVDTLSYTVTGTCGLTSTVRRVLTVNSVPAIGAGSTATVLIGGTITLTNSVSGGTWSTVTPSIASVAATTGVVRGRAAGLDTIKYA
ncbi:MAG: hypothetical protein EBZ77_05905, partial [Chitinophagia bacterium]|nr:hypothetical protein [Chitinophagia bacterium]